MGAASFWQKQNSKDTLTLCSAERYDLRLLLQKHILLLTLKTKALSNKEDFFQLLQTLPSKEQKLWQKNYQSYPSVTIQRLQRRCWLEHQLHFFNGEHHCLEGRHGKPTLKERRFFFNLSHSKKLTILALFHSPLGIDIELLDEREHRSLFHVLHPQEQRHLECFKGSRKLNQAFMRIWTRQEALAKLSGQAISKTLGQQTLHWESKPPSFRQLYFHEETYSNHYLCLVSRRPFRCLWWSKDRFC